MQVTYYRIKTYLKQHGLTEGQADYVRSMIRRLVETKVCDEVAPFISDKTLEQRAAKLAQDKINNRTVCWQRYPENPVSSRFFEQRSDAVAFLMRKREDYRYTVGRAWMPDGRGNHILCIKRCLTGHVLDTDYNATAILLDTKTACSEQFWFSVLSRSGNRSRKVSLCEAI